MRLAILIMSTEVEPSLRNVEAMKKTMVKQTNEESFDNEYDFFTYTCVDNPNKDYDTVLSCEKDEAYKNYYSIRINEQESVYRTFEKTYVTYRYLLDNEEKYGKYDKFIRINISCYVNIRLLDKLVSQMKDDVIYTNALNTYVNLLSPCINKLYPRGDFYIIPHDILTQVMKIGKVFMHCDSSLSSTGRPDIPHVDDTLFGYAFILYAGETYYKNLQMIKYNFLPFTSENVDLINSYVDKYAISTRVKTTPPGHVSGYSWDDNDWRRHDPAKIEIVHNNVKDIEYKDVTLEDVLVSPLQERDTIFIQPSNLKPYQIIAMTT